MTRTALIPLAIFALVLEGCSGSKDSRPTATTETAEQAITGLARLDGKIKRATLASNDKELAADFEGTELTDEDMDAVASHLLALPQVTQLNLINTKVTEKGVAKLKDVKQLNRLGLSLALKDSPAALKWKSENDNRGIFHPIVRTGKPLDPPDKPKE